MSMYEVYNNPTNYPSGIQELRIHTVDIGLYNSPSMFTEEDARSAAIRVPVKELRLQKIGCSLHITYEELESRLNINLDQLYPNLREATTGLQAVAKLIGGVSIETSERLKELEPIERGHPVILERVRVIPQQASHLLLIDVEFWVTQVRGADIGKYVFERTLHKALTGQLQRRVAPRPDYPVNLPYFDQHTHKRQKYDIDAEENAHELLKSLITKKEFETYKLEGYLKVKGTYGRTYKIKKGDMIAVTQKRMGQKKKTYRLCLEPRDRGTICPTDEVIAKLKLIQVSEKELHKLGNRFDDNILRECIPEIWAEALRARQIRGM